MKDHRARGAPGAIMSSCASVEITVFSDRTFRTIEPTLTHAYARIRAAKSAARVNGVINISHRECYRYTGSRASYVNFRGTPDIIGLIRCVSRAIYRRPLFTPRVITSFYINYIEPVINQHCVMLKFNKRPGGNPSRVARRCVSSISPIYSP